ncbi:mycofactocin-coupled SDR family oxidoreductase [Gordonia liuliyuniae]|uniref:Mycofactocin-coupled SDR family oxidoreductase n=1 Tax=Gordonia liuliyuniae TaxID=2911517 RepID=A0ABS9IWB9_9ACTN|nr:mycofactocin-coupled SDR family oxidoreductase [Gordonia liuliyuniae]MCF8589861.1 mycofactocin-coupled SDR family oxidoreductase [Gordonia liuliyuniae]
MADFDGKVVAISGAARGQGRSHAVRFAKEGARLVLFDICGQMSEVPYAMATKNDLDETVRLVQEAGAEVVSGVADARTYDEVAAVMQSGIDAFGSPDVVVANAGIWSEAGALWEMTPKDFRAVVDVDLIGAWHTFRAALPTMVDAGKGGSIIATISAAGLKPLQNIGNYVAAKHGLVGLVKTAALELAPHGIRANCVSPGNTNTPIFRNDAMKRLFVPDQDEPSDDVFLSRAAGMVPLGVPYMEPGDITEAVLWLASDHARYVTGTNISVDGGSAIS